MNEKIKNLLNTPEKLLALAEKVRETPENTKISEDFHSALATELDAWVANEAATDVWKLLLAESFVPKDDQKAAMIEATEEATKIVGDWNEEAAKLAQKIWETKLGLERVEMVGYDELFENEEFVGLQAYDRKTLEAMPDTNFVFVNEGVRRFPVSSAKEAFLAIKSLALNSETMTEDELAVVTRAVEEHGVGINYVNVILAEEIPIAQLAMDRPIEADELKLLVESYDLTEEEEATLTAAAEAFYKVFNEEITAESLENFPQPLVLNASSIVRKFAERENQVDYLAPLVGLVRTLGISKEKFDEAARIYNCFGVTVLQKLLERGFAAPSTKEGNGTDDAQPESQVPTLSNPVAQTTPGETGKPSPTKSSLELAYKPINRRSLKKKNTK